MASIALEGVSKNFGKTEVVRGINFEVADREFLVFVGPSGCGKSTLLRLIAGLEKVGGGLIKIDGKDATEVSAAKRGLSMVFQSYALYPHMTVRDNMAFGLKMAKTPPAEIDEKVSRAAAVLKLEEHLHKKPRALSGGQRQRVAIGRAIVREPKAFLFDEPLSNLDAALRVNMRLEIGELHRRLGATTIYVTHDQTEAMTMADRIAVMNAGRIEQAGSPLELYRRPSNLFVAGFIGSPKMNFIGGDIAARLGAATLGVRPEHLAVSADSGEWRGTVEFLEHLGADTFAHIRADNIGRLTVRVGGDSPLQREEQVFLSPAPDSLHRFDGEGNAVVG